MTTSPPARVFTLPDLGEGLTGAEVVAWRVAVGDRVAIDQVVVDVETAKATVEVPVPFAGTVLELHGDAGEVLDVGAPLLTVGVAAADRPAVPAPRANGSGSVLVGYGTEHLTARRRRDRGAAAPATPNGCAASAPARQTVPGDPAAPLVISPLVRRFAREHGVDVALLTGSGPHGVVCRRDVEEAISGAAHPAPSGAGERSGGTERVPLRGVLGSAAEKFAVSGRTPTATAWVDADATGLLEAREVLRAARPARGIGLLALLARICVTGLGEFPELNAALDAGRGEIVRFREVHLGFAAQTDRGLLVPVVRGAHARSTAGLAADLSRLTALARAGELRPGALTGGTFTLNNYGVFGVDGSTPLLNPPEAAMLGVGRIVDKPWVCGGQLAVRKVVQLSITFDHRVCDGRSAAGFLRHVADRVERPTLLLADL
ncbi:dihydrolipoamide acetyltransferase family protein [Streptomyces sp. NPDC094437]|uniref:dihydrolipoamide acetyltransferase family protein n=1 Tax=Streptomyces sp. NPDC094437 TaxID=3366060 RepID=UPI003825877E